MIIHLVYPIKILNDVLTTQWAVVRYDLYEIITINRFRLS